MPTTEQPDRYNKASIALHWIMLLLLAGVYAAIEFREAYPKGSGPRELLKAAHFTLGLTIFALVWIRLAARRIMPAPADEQASAIWQRVAARLIHLALYAFMIAMPLAGWIILSAEGKSIPFYGFEFPPLVDPNETLAETVEGLHELGGAIGYYLIGFHAAAALFHHYVLRDNVLARMLPGARRGLPLEAIRE